MKERTLTRLLGWISIVPLILACLWIQAGCRQKMAEESWLDRLHEEARQIFYQTLSQGIKLHPQRERLTAGEIEKIQNAQSLYPRLFELLINVFYQKDEPVFTALLEKGDLDSKDLFRRKYLDLVRFAGQAFVDCFFKTDAQTEYVRSSIPAYKGLDAVDLVIRSLGYHAKLDIPQRKMFANPVSSEFERQWGLDAARFSEAHRLTKGAGAKIAVLDTGIDESHSIFKNTKWGRHFSLVGREGKPWASDVTTIDWGSHGTLISSVVACYAPEAQITMYKFGDGDTQNDPPYQSLLQYIVAAAIYKAVHDGNDVISLSASGVSLELDYLKEAVEYAERNNRVLVSGNLYHHVLRGGQNLNFPGQCGTVVSVTAIEKRADGTLGYWDICAPDDSTTIAGPNGVFGAFPTYIGEKDTYIPSISAAIPVISSLAALAISQYPRLGTEKPGEYAASIRKLITENANPRILGNEGFSPQCGFGLADAEKTVVAARRMERKRRDWVARLQPSGPAPDKLYDDGRKAFYERLKYDLAMDERSFELIPADLERILNSEKDLPLLYENIINILFPAFEFQAGGGERGEKFGAMFLSLCRQGADHFVRSLFAEDQRTEALVHNPRNSQKTRLGLVLESFGYMPGNEAPKSDRKIPGASWGLRVSRFDTAQATAKGRGKRVAIVSSGGDFDHPLLAEARLDREKSFSLVNRVGAPWTEEKTLPSDERGRGTILASIVSAFAPESEILILKIACDREQPYPYWPAMQVAQAIYKALAEGADVIIADAGFGSDFGFLREACQFAHDRNVVICAPSGDILDAGSAGQADYPAAYNSTIALVAAVPEPSGKTAVWEKSLPQRTIDFAAPAVVGGEPSLINSAAAAATGALVALLGERMPKTKDHLAGQYYQAIYEILASSADPHAFGSKSYTLRHGYGLIDAELATGKGIEDYLAKIRAVEEARRKRMEEREKKEKK